MALSHIKHLCIAVILTIVPFVASGPILSIEPVNMTVVIGRTVRFRCQAESSPDDTAISVSWTRLGTVISDDRQVFADTVESERYSIIGQTDNDYDLQIIDVRVNDKSMFKCQASGPGGTVISQPVFLTVQYPPDTDQLRCSKVLSYLTDGDPIEPEPNCSLPKLGVPPATLNWITANGRNVSHSYRDKDYTNSVVLRFRKNVTIEDNGREFFCIIIHPLVTERTQCTLGPLVVYHAPVNATITSAAVGHVEGNDLEFQCLANANPQYDVTVTWSTEPQYDGKTFLSDRESVIHFSNVPLKLNNTMLICNASNSRGFSTDSIVIFIALQRVTQPPLLPKPTSDGNRSATSPPKKTPDTLLIAFILIGVIFLLLFIVVVILIIGRKWREPIIFVDVNDELCRRSLSGGGSLVLGSNSHIVVHRTPNGERHLFQIHHGQNDSYSIDSADTCGSSHHGSASMPHDTESYPSDPQKAAKIEGTGFYRSAHTSRHNSINSECSNTSNYERSICSDSRPGTPTRSQDPLPPRPDEAIAMTTVNAEHVTLDDTEHHAEKNYYMNTPTKKTQKVAEGSRDETSSKRDSGEHRYEDITPVLKRKFNDQDDDTGEEDFPDNDRPRITSEKTLDQKENGIFETMH